MQPRIAAIMIHLIYSLELQEQPLEVFYKKSYF